MKFKRVTDAEELPASPAFGREPLLNKPWEEHQREATKTILSHKSFQEKELSLKTKHYAQSKQRLGILRLLKTLLALAREEKYEEHQQKQFAVRTLPSTVNDFLAPPRQSELVGHSTACVSYPYPDPHYGGAIPPYGPQPLLHPPSLGVHSSRMVLPLQMEEEPVYVNAKQYHGILRRRQSRAKAELKKKAIKVRKPYLHESRHLHALRRARGCGGRFLTTKKVDGTAANTANKNQDTVSSGHKGISPKLSAIADSDSGSREAWNPHQSDIRSSSNGNNYYTHVHGFELSGYQSLSSDKGNQSDFSGARRVLTIK